MGEGQEQAGEAEAAFRKGEARFRTLVASMDDIVFTLDREQRHTGMFGRWIERSGVKPEQYLGRTAREILGPAGAAVYESAAARAFEGESVTFEWSVPGEAGHLWFETTLSPLRDEHGVVSGLVGIGRDVTRKKRDEDEVHRAARRNHVLASVSKTLAEATSSLDTLLGRITEEVAREVGDACVLALCSDDEAGSWLDPVALSHRVPEAAGFIRSLLSAGRTRLGEGIAGSVAATGVSILLPEVPQEALRSRLSPANRGYLDRYGIHSLLIVPMRVQGRTLGTLGVTRDRPGNPYAEADRELLEDLAERAALAIENARLHEAAQRELGERKQVEAALRRSEARLAEAQRIASIGNWEWDVGGGTLYWSDTIYRLFGLVPGRIEPTFDRFMAFVHPEDREAVAGAVRRALYDRAPYDSLFRVVRADGERRTVHARGEVVFDAAGTPATMVGTMQDVTERVAAELALQQREEYFRALVQNAYEIVTILGPDGTIQYESDSIATVLGYHPEALLGRSVFDFVHPEDAAATTAALHTLLEQPAATMHVDVRFRHLDGSWRALSASGMNLLDHPVVRGIVVNARDVTERRQAEEALKRYAAEMEAVKAELEERNLWLASANTELRLAHARAEAATRVKSDFLARMSHEIRTPMNGVIGMTELLLDTPLTESQREYAQAVANSGEALLALINDILDFSKIEAGRLVLERVVFDLPQVVQEVTELFAPKAAEKGLEIACHLAPGVPTELVGDPYRLRQILTNLTSNAVKFTEHGEVILSVEAVADAAGQPAVRFEVRDTGIGLPDAARAHLFEAFAQGETSTTRRFGGTGLGLAISRQLVELMGGTIAVESTAGHGTAFHFTVAAEAPAQPARPALDAGTRLEGLRFLLVEPNHSVRRILRLQLEAWRVAVVACESSAQALLQVTAALGQQTRFDAALIARNMLDIDGLSLARAIRAMTGPAPPKVVLLAGINQREHAGGRPDGAVQAALTKPVRPAQLLDALSSLFSSAAASPAPAGAPPPAPAEEPVFASARVLLAEDNPTNQAVATAMLHKLGCAVDTVANGREAVRAVQQRRYTAVLMDIQMPEMDGHQATAAIRALRGPAGRVPVVALTANALRGDRETCLAAGMDDYLSKPFKLEALQLVLGRWLHRAGAPAPEAPPEAPYPAPDAAPDAASGAPAASPGALDPTHVAALVEDIGAENVVLVITEYLETVPRQLDELAQALASNQARQVERLAHSLGGACAIVGATHLAERCRGLERQAKLHNLHPGAEHVLAGLRVEHERACEALRRVVQQIEHGDGP